MQVIEQPDRLHAHTSLAIVNGRWRSTVNCRCQIRWSTFAVATSALGRRCARAREIPSPNGSGVSKQPRITSTVSSHGALRSWRYPASHRRLPDISEASPVNVSYCQPASSQALRVILNCSAFFSTRSEDRTSTSRPSPLERRTKKSGTWSRCPEVSRGHRSARGWTAIATMSLATSAARTSAASKYSRSSSDSKSTWRRLVLDQYRPS
jgi:hypothetical protein